MDPLLLGGVFVWSVLSSESTDIPSNQRDIVRFRSISDTWALAGHRMSPFRWGTSLPAGGWTAFAHLHQLPGPFRLLNF